MSASLDSVLPPLPACSPPLAAVFQRIHGLIGQHAALGREAAECVAALKQHCERQFAAEENSPLLREVALHAPWLERSVSDLSRQHAALRNRLTSLSRSLERHQPLPRCWEEFAEEFTFFERQLSLHESAEVDVWQELCNQDLGAKD